MSQAKNKSIDPITLSVLWARLISIVDEAGTTLQRTSFSTVTRESNDFAVVLMDESGRSIAQSSISVPSFLGVIPMLTKALLTHYFPVHTWNEGDAVITNDPWLCAGHKPDIGIVSPIFYQKKLIGFIGTIAHSPDMGGVLWGAGARDFYEEGLLLPPLKLIEECKYRDDIISIIHGNVRAADQTLGDIRAQVAANEQGIRSLIQLMGEYELNTLKEVADEIITTTERAMRKSLSDVPDGDYPFEYKVDGDGQHEPLRLKLIVSIRKDTIHLDWSGSAPASPLAINAVMNYTYAYTAYPVKCIFSPDIPNNEGAFYPITVYAENGSLLNAQKPSPLGARNITGNILHAPVFGALAQIVPEKVQADCGSACWSVVLNGIDLYGREFVEYFFLNGGYGARPDRDGIHTLSFPTNVANVPIEVLEHSVPILVTRKSLANGSGGDGKFRGGLGQDFWFKNTGNVSLNISILTEKIRTRSKGLLGGHDGSSGTIQIIPERPFPKKGLEKLYPGEELRLRVPGGGGFGEPMDRSPDLIQRDQFYKYF
ncbi:MAG TPA: hydantoinase B/oxoprolinase family protein [Saprospiraceae bacterium]|nr:hydantoinase B/oxoprolinase family protein [Saprospiraceae bacterium]